MDNYGQRRFLKIKEEVGENYVCLRIHRYIPNNPAPGLIKLNNTKEYIYVYPPNTFERILGITFEIKIRKAYVKLNRYLDKLFIKELNFVYEYSNWKEKEKEKENAKTKVERVSWSIIPDIHESCDIYNSEPKEQ